MNILLMIAGDLEHLFHFVHHQITWFLKYHSILRSFCCIL